MNADSHHHRVTERIAAAIFRARKGLLLVFAIITVALGSSATQLRVDAGFNKMIPLEHPYMKVFTAIRASLRRRQPHGLVL